MRGLQCRIDENITFKINANLQDVDTILPGADIMSRRKALDRAMLVFWGKPTAARVFWRREY